jgi:hypothetical protein
VSLDHFSPETTANCAYVAVTAFLTPSHFKRVRVKKNLFASVESQEKDQRECDEERSREKREEEKCGGELN